MVACLEGLTFASAALCFSALAVREDILARVKCRLNLALPCKFSSFGN